jgi:hypothetical protein
MPGKQMQILHPPRRIQDDSAVGKQVSALVRSRTNRGLKYIQAAFIDSIRQSSLRVSSPSAPSPAQSAGTQRTNADPSSAAADSG